MKEEEKSLFEFLEGCLGLLEGDLERNIRLLVHPDISPDAQTVRFSEITAEAEAEMAEWEKILHPKQ